MSTTMSPIPLTARLTRGEIILLDGALGTELERRGVQARRPLWSAQALLEAPDRVREIHEEYVRAGADILTANTFRTTPRALGGAGLGGESERLTALAIALCREARERAGLERGVWIAGSMAPLEDCYRPELAPPPEAAEREHREQAERLERAGAELLLIETMNSIPEAVAAVRGAQTTALPVLVSFICKNAREIWSGELLADAVRAVEALQPDAILVNCTPPDVAEGSLDEIARTTHLPIGCYPNAGGPDLEHGTWRFDPEMTPKRFAEAAQAWVRSGAQIVGGCCGTGPDHTRALRAALPPVLVE
jgi:S-methylmethionine-dependent homocysteine/selenocysteine methylase